ncbi:gamma-butyrobetaine dioxygenase-like [Littorina saxatilis]|uniref:Gamma-butyrobetaine dioxygenase n=1 Tax=Littorina saxatilis TaxID=31220 RepID=A0AAN9BF75_9CAEN
MALSQSMTTFLRCLSPKGTELQATRSFSRIFRPGSRSGQGHSTCTAGCVTTLLQPRTLPLKPGCVQASSAAPAASMKADKPLTAQGEITSFEVNSKGNILNITWHDGQKSNFHSLWLRYSCNCKACLEENTGQRLYLCENLDPDVLIKSVEREGDNLVVVFRGKENHKGFVPIQFLKQYDYSSKALAIKKAAIEVNIYATEIPELTYDDVTQKEDGVYRWTKNLSDYGFCVIKGVPTEETMVTKMAEMIGPIQDTIYDDVFDVHVSDHQLTNVAYSADGLIYHQDLLYYESPPGLQFLHTLKFDDCVSGGESLIVDAFKVANEFRQSHPNEFEALATIPATFQKIHYGRSVPVHMTFTRPLIGLNAEKQIVGVHWEPAHEGPIEVPENRVEDFYRAHIAFAKAVKEAPVQFEWRMQEGDLLVFNNRRVCHARNGFVMNGGTRHLKGCYVNIDHFKSRVNVLSQKFGNGDLSKRVGNMCLF